MRADRSEIALARARHSGSPLSIWPLPLRVCCCAIAGSVDVHALLTPGHAHCRRLPALASYVHAAPADHIQTHGGGRRRARPASSLSATVRSRRSYRAVDRSAAPATGDRTLHARRTRQPVDLPPCALTVAAVRGVLLVRRALSRRSLRRASAAARSHSGASPRSHSISPPERSACAARHLPPSAQRRSIRADPAAIAL